VECCVDITSSHRSPTPTPNYMPILPTFICTSPKPKWELPSILTQLLSTFRLRPLYSAVSTTVRVLVVRESRPSLCMRRPQMSLSRRRTAKFCFPAVSSLPALSRHCLMVRNHCCSIFSLLFLFFLSGSPLRSVSQGTLFFTTFVLI
jgi:hypothetical protein